MKLTHSAGLCALLFAGPSLIGGYAQAASSLADVITSAVADPARPQGDRNRDVARKPVESLQFSGVKPGDAVADFNASAGYFTRLFSDVVGSRGHVYAIEPVEIQQYIAKSTAELRGYAANHRNITVLVETAIESLHLPGKLDLFWISQNYHDLHNKYFGPVDIAAFNKAVFDALKPGGAYVVLDHTAAPGAPADVTETLHRIDPGTVRREVEAAGFVFDSESVILANPADPRTIKVFEKSIQGHTDQFILKFRKPASAARDGQRDFDFNLGTWRTHVRRLLHPLTGSPTWAEYDGTSVVSKVWDGRASLLELEADGPAGRVEGLGLRLYNPESHQWSLNWASRVDGQFQPPMIGQFAAGRGEFVDHEVVSAKSILSRNAFSDISPDFARFEQSFSDDGGRSWEANWVMTFTRIRAGAHTFSTAVPPDHNSPPPTAGPTATEHDGQHDFDFAFGTWKTHIMRLKDPLSGSTSWIEYDGTHTIRRVWGGLANLGELEADGPAGHIEAMSPRLYNSQTHLWSVSYGNPHDGNLSRLLAGQFKSGHGEFYGQDTFKGRVVLVREIYSPIDSRTRRLEIAYSEDGGRNWDTNWRMTDTFVGAATDTTK